MRNKLINVYLLLAVLCLTRLSAQTLTMKCGNQKQELTELNQTQLEFFESDTLHITLTNKSGTTGFVDGDILIVPKTGTSYYEKISSKKPFMLTGVLQMHRSKLLAEGTKIIINLKGKAYPNTCFTTIVI